jgi:nitric oxide reductase NorD protein
MPKFMNRIRQQNDSLQLDLTRLGVTTHERNATLQVEIESMRSLIKESMDGEIDIESMIEQRKAHEQFNAAVRKYADISAVQEINNHTGLYLYPEWDIEKNCYINDHCILSELSLPPVNRRNQDNLRNRYSGFLESVKKAFLKMKPDSFVQHRGMDDGHEIDFDRYVDALMDFSSGNQMENNFYIFRERKIRSVLSGLVLDMSPSTDEEVEGGTIFLYQKYATYLLSEAMNIIGDPFGIFTFYDYGPSATFFYTLKDFSESYSSNHYKRLCSFKPSPRGFSRLSVGLRHIIGKMKEHEAKSKIIFFITDGFPCYFEDAIDRGETASVFYVDGTRRVEVDKPVPVVDAVYKRKHYVLHDLRKVREEATLAGIELFCITLDANSISFMEDVFGNALIYLPEISELPKRLLEIFRKTTS